MISKRIHFVNYKDRHCTDVFCLIIFILFIFIYIFISIIVIIHGHPKNYIKSSDSFGNLCGQDQFQFRPYEFDFDISKCLIDNSLSFICSTKKICIKTCPTYYSNYQSLQTIENTHILSRNLTRNQLICIYNYNPQEDNRSIIEIINNELCAPYTIPSKPFLGRCLPLILTNLFDYEQNQKNISIKQLNTQIFHFDKLLNIIRIILFDLNQIKESFILFIFIGCLLTLIYMFIMKLFTGFIVFFTIILFIIILFILSTFCWYIIYTGNDFIYEYSTIARIINNFIKLRTIYYIFGCITIFLFCLSLFIILTLFNRIHLSIVLLKQGIKSVFSILSTLLWSLFIIILFILLTLIIIYIEICLSTIDKPILNNQSKACIPNLNSTKCIFQQTYNYNELIFHYIDIIIHYIINLKIYFQCFNLFAYLWFGTFIFAFEEIVLAVIFSNSYWSKKSISLLYSIILILRYHIGSIAFGSLVLTILKSIRILFDYIYRKISSIKKNLFIRFLFKCFNCFIWLFEKFLKYLNKNSYILIALHGYSFCQATRKTFIYITNNYLQLLVLIHLIQWIFLFGISFICICNSYLFYYYLYWTNQYNQLIFHWIPIIIMIVINYLISRIFFNVYDMAIKTLFVCFIEDFDENYGSIEHSYVMNNEILCLIHKTNQVEKK